MSISAIACTSAPAECDCADNTVQIHIPADLAASASTPVLSQACANASLACTQTAAAGGCETYSFTPPAAGQCEIDIDFSDGHVFSSPLTIEPGPACCPGFYVSPTSAADVEVPEGT
jgi:hypothetical protein